MTEAELRAAIVAEAMTWLGTPYHHRAKLKGIGVDCAQVVLAVYAAVGIVEDFDTGEYPADWHIHRDVERYVKAVIPHGHEIPTKDAKPGDLVLFKFGRVFSHGAIVIAGPRVLHAHQAIGKVVLGDMDRDADLLGRESRCFSYWEPSNGR